MEEGAMGGAATATGNRAWGRETRVRAAWLVDGEAVSEARKATGAAGELAAAAPSC